MPRTCSYLIALQHLVSYMLTLNFSRQDYGSQDSDMPQIDPVFANSLGACLDLCMNQGTLCLGVSWVPSTNQCRMKFFMVRLCIQIFFLTHCDYYGRICETSLGYMLTFRQQVTAQPSYEVNSAVRMTGPGELSTRLLTNGAFDSGSLSPWTSCSSGAGVSVVNGQVYGSSLLRSVSTLS